MYKKLQFQAGCQTTAMGIMPHTSLERALEFALDLDIPFWPQLPNTSFYEDMYVQTSQNFPGIVIDTENEKIGFNNIKFESELRAYSEKMNEPEIFLLSHNYSKIFHAFLEKDLKDYAAIRGQLTGPVSFGFRITDEDSRPIIYNDGVRALLFDFIQRKANSQYRQLKEKNPNAFVWLDEPGLGWVFSGLSGYNDIQAKHDYHDFLDGLDGPRALHLCASVNLPYLLQLEIQILSFDAYQIGVMPKGYASAVADFVKRGGIIAWGIVPTDSAGLLKETPTTLAALLSGYWKVIAKNTDVPLQMIAEQALLAPARCCLKNSGKVGASDDSTKTIKATSSQTIEEQLVEQAFSCLVELSKILQEKFRL